MSSNSVNKDNTENIKDTGKNNIPKKSGDFVADVVEWVETFAICQKS